MSDGEVWSDAELVVRIGIELYAATKVSRCCIRTRLLGTVTCLKERLLVISRNLIVIIDFKLLWLFGK
jgi:hypothetical protein